MESRIQEPLCAHNTPKSSYRSLPCVAPIPLPLPYFLSASLPARRGQKSSSLGPLCLVDRPRPFYEFFSKNSSKGLSTENSLGNAIYNINLRDLSSLFVLFDSFIRPQPVSASHYSGKV